MVRPTSQRLPWLGLLVVLDLLLTGCGGGSGGGSGAPVSAPASPDTPVVLSLAATGVPVAPGGAATVQVIAQSPAGLDLSYAWTAGDGWALTGGGASAAAAFAPRAGAGSGNATVTVTDPQGNQSTSSLSLAPAAVAGPTLTTLTASPNPAASGGTQVLTATLQATAATLTYSWTVPAGWTIASGQGTAKLTLTAPSAANATGQARLTVTDSLGNIATGVVAVATGGVTAPTLNPLTAGLDPVPVGGSTVLAAPATAAPGQTLAYAWTLPTGWSIAAGQGTPALLVTAPTGYDVSGPATVKVSNSQGGASTFGLLELTTVAAPVPTLTTVTATPNPVPAGASTILTAVAAGGAGAPLAYTWTVPSGWTIVSGQGTAALTVKAPAAYGNQGQCSVLVDNGQGGAVDGAVVVTTVSDPVPALNALNARPDPVAAGGTMTLQAVATGDTVSYAWTVPSGWTIASGQGTSTLAVTAPDAYGAAGDVTVTVANPAGATVNGLIAVGTLGDPLPTLSAIAVSPSPAGRGATVTFSATAAGAPGDKLSYGWTLPGGWSIQSGQGTANLTATAPDQYAADGSALLTVSSPAGTASGQIGVGTASDPLPALGPLTASPNPVPAGATTNLTAAATGAPGDTLSYTWTVPAGWQVMAGQGGPVLTVQAPSVYSSPGSFVVSVGNGNGGAMTGLITLSTAGDPAPALASLTATPNPAPPGTAMTLQAAAGGASADALSYAWTVPSGWSVQSGQGTATLTVMAPGVAAAAGDVTVTMANPSGGSVNGLIAVGTQGDPLPTLSAVTASPNPAGLQASVTFTAAAGAAGETLGYQWTLPGGWTIQSGQGTATLTATAPNQYADPGNALVAVSSPTGSVQGQVGITTVSDPLPVLSPLTASPNPAPLGATVTLHANASGAPGDSLSYTWAVPSAWTIVSGQSTDTLTVTAPTTAPTSSSSGSATVTVANGNGGSVAGQITLVLAASTGGGPGGIPPVLASFTASPIPVVKGGTVTLSAIASGAPGDSLSYTWTVPSAWTIVSGQSTSTLKLTAPTSYAASGTVTVTVTNSAGASVNGLLTVSTFGDPLPVLGQPAITTAPGTPVAPGTQVTLTANATSTTSDPLTYVWTVPQNGILVTLPASTSNTITVTAPSPYDSSAEILVTVSNTAGGSVNGSLALTTSSANPASVELAAAQTPSYLLGSSADGFDLYGNGSELVQVTAYDANHVPIVAGSPGAASFSLASSSSAVTVTSASGPGQYSLQTATFDATASLTLSVTPASGPAVTATVPVNTHHRIIWVADSSANAVDEWYADNLNTWHQTFNLGSPIVGFAAAADGSFFASMSEGVDVFESFAPISGITNTTATVPGNSGLNQQLGGCYDHEGNLYLVNSGNHDVLKFLPGNPTPSVVYTASYAGGNFTPVGCAIDQDDSLWVISSPDAMVVHYPANPSNPGTPDSVRPILQDSTKSYVPIAIAIDRAGTLYLAVHNSTVNLTSVQSFAKGFTSQGFTISTETGDGSGTSLAVDAAGKLWVGTGGGHLVHFALPLGVGSVPIEPSFPYGNTNNLGRTGEIIGIGVFPQ